MGGLGYKGHKVMKAQFHILSMSSFLRGENIGFLKLKPGARGVNAGCGNHATSYEKNYAPPRQMTQLPGNTTCLQEEMAGRGPQFYEGFTIIDEWAYE